ncbi:hypothetical protein EYS14_19060 [Alteromonadaceae bacterium M269]|nr:hypothetical protein EYS14_19060 [Alteromonadaceae bacterium M269]
MIEKEYYRLSELESKFGISEEDIQYWFERSELSFVFPQSYQKYVIGGWLKSGGFCGFGIAGYKGLISISKNSERLVLEKSKTDVQQCNLINKKNIEVLSNDYQFKVPVPNKVIAGWQPRELKQITWDVMPAKLYPSVEKDIVEKLKKNMERFMEEKPVMPIKQAIAESRKYLAESDDDIPDVIRPSYITINKQDMCVLNTDIKRLTSIVEITPLPDQLIEKKVQQLQEIEHEPSKPNERKSQFTELLMRLADANPKMTARESWRILKDEVKQGSDERQYDIEGILVDVSSTEIAWYSRYNNLSHIKQTTFDSSWSRAKKKLNDSNK